jgi:hypothetical protein
MNEMNIKIYEILLTFGTKSQITRKIIIPILIHKCEFPILILV